eukprot:5577259-Alexandrium_andersonii.AAC.1
MRCSGSSCMLSLALALALALALQVDSVRSAGVQTCSLACKRVRVVWLALFLVMLVGGIVQLPVLACWA